jgi:L-threonylcarbamoyladenylate synthase
MSLRRVVVDAAIVAPADLMPAVEWLRHGGVVAFPTDTSYGLAVDPTSEAAVHGLFMLKGRSARAALPLIAASVSQIEAACGQLDRASARLAGAWWPGPLSLLLDAPTGISAAVHGGSRSVAVRVPAHRVARLLADAWGGLLTATSANLSEAPPANAAGDLDALAADSRVFVVDGGPTAGGLPSTIVDARGPRATLIRDGAIPWERVLESLKG